MSQTDKERVIADLVDIYEIATPKKNAMLILADKAFTAGYRAAKEDAAKTAETQIGATRHEIAAAIRKLEPKP